MAPGHVGEAVPIDGIQLTTLDGVTHRITVEGPTRAGTFDPVSPPPPILDAPERATS